MKQRGGYFCPNFCPNSRERLLASGALDKVTVKTPPTIAEVADEARY
jgi:hypothetical protein